MAVEAPMLQMSTRGWTALHHAAATGQVEMLRLLIDAGGDVNVRAQDGWTPLHCAAYWGHEEAAQLLLDQGAEVDLPDNNGRTPLQVALLGAAEMRTKLAQS